MLWRILKVVILSVSFLALLSIDNLYSEGNTSIIYPSAPPKIELYDASIVNDEKKWTVNNVHDPAIIKAQNGWYYVYSTDVKVYGVPKPGIQIRKSKDLINWQWVGYVFDGDEYIFKGIPEDAFEWSRASNLWAPDVKFMNGKYYLYYAASLFGRNQSFIGLATSTHPEGPWKNEGEVIKTMQGDPVNAIDPNLCFDENGEPWLVYGSFWNGIYILKIDKLTGKPSEKGFGINIARRSPSVQGAVEGAYVIYNPKFRKYYLFVSYDSLSSDYNVRVGRADKITGPYVDYNGNLMTDITLPPNEVGTKILGGYKFKNDDGWVAPGHNSVLVDGDDYYIVHHVRPALNKNWMYLHVRKVLWSDGGWPLVSPERYAGEFEQKVSQDEVIGVWERIRLDRNNNLQVSSEVMKLLKDGKINDEKSKSHWELIGKNTIMLYWDISEKGGFLVETVKVIPAWDWENWKQSVVFTGLDQTGTAVWGKKI